MKCTYLEFLKRTVHKSINIANYIVYNKYCEHTCIVTYLLMHYSAVQSTYTIVNWNNVNLKHELILSTSYSRGLMGTAIFTQFCY